MKIRLKIIDSQDCKVFLACWMMIGRFKFQTRHPSAKKYVIKKNDFSFLCVYPVTDNEHGHKIAKPLGCPQLLDTVIHPKGCGNEVDCHKRNSWSITRQTGEKLTLRGRGERAWKRSCSFPWVWPVIDHEFRQNIVKVAVDLLGYRLVNPMTRLRRKTRWLTIGRFRKHNAPFI